MRKLLLVPIILIIVGGCMPDDIAVTPFDRGDITFGKTSLGSSYEKQIYFSLDNNKVISENNVGDWDLGFSCNEEFHIILNYGKFMKATNLGLVNYETVDANTAKSIDEEKWLYDNPFGKSDSLAIGKWWEFSNNVLLSQNNVYLIDKGVDLVGRSLGMVKFQVMEFKDNSYFVRFSDLKKPDNIQISIKKDSTYNYAHLSFLNGGKVNYFEPEKEKWDLMFTKYTELLYTSDGVPTWYSVVSVLINSKYMQAATVKTDDFANLTEAILLDSAKVIRPYNSDRNAIGHDWKYIILEGNKWVIYTNVAYLIKSTSGFTYKLHFTSFDDKGVKGNPMFEFQKL